MKTKLRLAAIVLAMLSGVPFAMAQEYPADAVVASADARAIVSQQEQIRAQSNAGEGRYRDMDEPTRRELANKQEIVLRLLKDKQLTTELSNNDQLILFNTLESIQAIINNAEDERMICRRERTISSNIPQRVCKTAAQIRREREEAERSIGGRELRCEGGCGEDASARPGNW